MKVYTRGGDGGETALFGGERVRKDFPRVESYGSVDELNACLGVVRASGIDAQLDAWLATIQSALFDVGGELATPDVEKLASKGQSIPRVSSAEVEELEAWIDTLDQELEPLRNFVLPGGAPAAAQLHLARTVCRRAERRAVSLAAEQEISEVLIRYLNRLSDLLFVMARAVNHRSQVAEPTWVGRER